MLRLLQGDVGSGKTIVALLAMADVVEAGRQAALMAPTEDSRAPAFERIAPLAAARSAHRVAHRSRQGVPSARARSRRWPRARSTSRSARMRCFRRASPSHDLGLAVVDEQHRFGVHQRLALGAKGEAVDILVMTATPIPRTLVLAYFGDMDVSDPARKAAGPPDRSRRARCRSIGSSEVVARLESAVAAGARAYWVCPLVEESEDARRRGCRGARSKR